MSPGKIDRDVVRRHLLALDETLTQLAGHAGRPLEALSSNLDERWAVERGLQLCVQNVLDLATHVVASAGRDVPDYTSAIEQLHIVVPWVAVAILHGHRFANHGFLEMQTSSSSATCGTATCPPQVFTT